MSVFIVIPAYNEEKSLEQVINNLLNLGYKNIVVVNDGSTDGTAQIMDRLPVYQVNHLMNLGQGAALMTGTQFAVELGAEIIVHFDADGQHQPHEITNFIEKLNQGYEVVLGSRFLHTKQHMPWTKKYLILKPAIWLNFLLTGLKLTDAHNGFRALKKVAAQKINIRQNGMAHNTEIPAEINYHGLSYTEIPVEIKYFHYGQNWKSGIKIIRDLLKNLILN